MQPKKIEGFVLVLVVLVSAYLMVVQLVNGLGSGRLIKSFAVVGSEKPAGQVGWFSINDFFVAEVECEHVSSYCLRFYRGSVLVFEKYAGASGPKFAANVSIAPPAFRADCSYVAVLDVYDYNEPVFGTFFSDSVSYVFEVGSAGTRIKFSGVFDGNSRELRLIANLTDVEGRPVVNETVDFGMLLCKKRHVTDDWEPLASAVTNASGLAEAYVGLSIPSGNYSFRAYHRGNENFGRSECSIAIPILANEAFGGPLASQFEGPSILGGSLTISCTTPVYALMRTSIDATYTSENSSTQGGPFWAAFYLDVIEGGFIGLSRLTIHAGHYPDDPWTGTGSINWIPRVVGDHRILCTILDSNANIIASTSLNRHITPCPSNVVIHHPEAMYGGDTNVTVAVAMPRRYNVTEMGGFVSTSLAPKLSYNGGTYAVDDCADATPVDLYFNGSLVGHKPTDENGLASFMPSLVFGGSRCTVWMRTVVNESIGLYQGWDTTEGLVFTRVNIADSPQGSAGQFSLNCTFLNTTQAAEPIYVGVSKAIEASTQLFGLPVCGSPVSAVIGKLKGRNCSASDGKIQKINLTDFMRIVAVYNLTETTTEATLDFIRDGKVDTKEVFAVGKAFGQVPGDPKWDWRADVVFDWKIDLKDYFAICKAFGKTVKYLDVTDYSVLRVSLYHDGQWVGETSVGRDGCTLLPFMMVTEIKLTLDGKPVGGVVEYFETTQHFEGVTDNVGHVGFSWVPQETAAVDFMLSGRKPPYFFSVWLPKHFSVFTDRWDPVTEVVSALSVVKLLDVLKRPVNLTVDMPCSFNVTVVEAVADASVYSNDANGRHGTENGLYVGGGGGTVYGERISYIGFDVSAVPAGAYIVSARLNLFLEDILPNYASGFTEYGVHRVTGPWDEATVTWSSRPSYVLEPSRVLTLGYPGGDFWDDWRWLVFDVTEDVRLWHGGSEANYGFALDRNPSTQQYLLKVSSRESCFSVRPRLEVSYISPLPVLVVNAYDAGAKKPAGALHVDVLVNGTLAGCGSTNSSGVFSVADWRPSMNRVFNLTAFSTGNDRLLVGRASAFLDLRFPTDITSFQGNPIGVVVGCEARFKCQLSSSYPCGLEARLNFYINGSSPSGERYCYRWCETTYPDGNLTIRWRPPWGGLFYMRTVFNGSSTYKPCETAALINASVTPLSILFSVSPSEFGVGRNIVLNATVMNAVTNTRLTAQSANVQFFKVDQYGNNCSVGSSTTVNGAALREYSYWDNQAYAFVARIQSYETEIPQCVVSSPVQLTVATPTKLLLNVANAGTSHTISGWLKYNSTGVVSEKVTVKINETATLLTTETGGFFSFTQDLRPVNNKPTMYTVTVSYNGSTPANATAWAHTTDGQRYVACTTVYFGYKPSANSTILTVDPQATKTMTATETMADKQKEAESKGWLSIWHEFSWFFPWYRLHFKLAMNGATFDIGFTPLLPIPGIFAPSIPDDFMPPIPIAGNPEAAQKIIFDISIGTAVELFGLAGIAVACPLTHIPGSAAIGLLIYGGGLGFLIGYATGLYFSGRTMEAFTALAGFAINGLGAGIGGLLSVLVHETAATFANSLAFPILGAVLSDLLDPSDLISVIIATTTIALIAFAVEYAIVHLIPDPLNCYFEPFFIGMSFAFAAIAISLLYTWAGWW